MGQPQRSTHGFRRSTTPHVGQDLATWLPAPSREYLALHADQQTGRWLDPAVGDVVQQSNHLGPVAIQPFGPGASAVLPVRLEDGCRASRPAPVVPIRRSAGGPTGIGCPIDRTGTHRLTAGGTGPGSAGAISHRWHDVGIRPRAGDHDPCRQTPLAETAGRNDSRHRTSSRQVGAPGQVAESSRDAPRAFGVSRQSSATSALVHARRTARGR